MFPARFDEERKRWMLDEGPVSWDEVMARWEGALPEESSACSGAIASDRAAA